MAAASDGEEAASDGEEEASDGEEAASDGEEAASDDEEAASGGEGAEEQKQKEQWEREHPARQHRSGIWLAPLECTSGGVGGA
jgi:hypothetical protein